MLLLMDCGVFFMQNENLCVFSKINFLVEKGQVIQQHAPSFLSHHLHLHHHHHHSSSSLLIFFTERKKRKEEEEEEKKSNAGDDDVFVAKKQRGHTFERRYVFFFFFFFSGANHPSHSETIESTRVALLRLFVAHLVRRFSLLIFFVERRKKRRRK
jgi:hypothetical protein